MDELISIVEGYTMPYGKFKGETVGALALTERGYLDWLAENSRDPVFKFALNKYLDAGGTVGNVRNQ
jgi:uncharacterized protein (DUF3820 family)